MMAALYAENASFIRQPRFPADMMAAHHHAAAAPPARLLAEDARHVRQTYKAPATTLAENASLVRPPWIPVAPGVQQVLCCDAPVL